MPLGSPSIMNRLEVVAVRSCSLTGKSMPVDFHGEVTRLRIMFRLAWVGQLVVFSFVSWLAWQSCF